MTLPFLGFLGLIAIEYMGLASMIPVLNSVKAPLVLALSLFGYVVVKNKDQLQTVLGSFQFKILMIFLSWAGISVLYALIASRAFNMVIVQASYLILFVVAFFLLRNHDQLRRFMFFSLAIHFILVLLNLDKLTHGGRTESLTAGYFVGDGNDFGWSLAIYFPFTFYLLHEYKSFLLRCITALFGATAFIGIMLTGSRGGSIAVFASIVYIITRMRKKAMVLAVVAIIALITLAVATPTYIERMHSIKDYQEDSSAKGRIMAWSAAVQMAFDYPIGIGAGNFPSVYGRFYRDTFADPSVYAPNRWISPHSIYFLTLAEYGFGGLIMLLWFLYGMFRQNSYSESMMQSRGGNPGGQPWLPISLKASLIALSVDGIFLGGLNYPHIYLFAAMSLATREMATKVQGVESYKIQSLGG